MRQPADDLGGDLTAREYKHDQRPKEQISRRLDSERTSQIDLNKQQLWRRTRYRGGHRERRGGKRAKPRSPSEVPKLVLGFAESQVRSLMSWCGTWPPVKLLHKRPLRHDMPKRGPTPRSERKSPLRRVRRAHRRPRPQRSGSRRRRRAGGRRRCQRRRCALLGSSCAVAFQQDSCARTDSPSHGVKHERGSGPLNAWSNRVP